MLKVVSTNGFGLLFYFRYSLIIFRQIFGDIWKEEKLKIFSTRISPLEK